MRRTTHLVQEDVTDTRFRNVDSLNSDAGVIPKRKYSTAEDSLTSIILNQLNKFISFFIGLLLND
jgi:hypothetical protein